MTQEKSFDFVPGLEELASRLQLDPQEEPYIGVVLMGEAGKAYSVVQLLAHHVAFTAQAVQLIVDMASSVRKEIEEHEHNKGSGLPETADTPDRDTPVS